MDRVATARKSGRGDEPGPWEAELEREIARSETARQVIIAPVPELIYPFDLPERPSTWKRLGDVLKLLKAENPALMRQADRG